MNSITAHTRAKTFIASELRELALKHLDPVSVDCDIFGKGMTDYDVLLAGAFAPAVERVVNLALHQVGGVKRQLERCELMPIAYEAVNQKTDYNFSKPPQPISNYGILLVDMSSNYSAHLLALVNLALRLTYDSAELALRVSLDDANGGN